MRQIKIESIETERRILPKRVRPSIDIEALRAQAAAEAQSVSDIEQVDTHSITQELESRRIEHSLRVLERVEIVEQIWKEKVDSFKQISSSLELLHRQLDRFQEAREVGSEREQESLSIAIDRLTQDYQNLAFQLEHRFEYTFHIDH